MSNLLIDWQNVWNQIVNFCSTMGLKILEAIGIFILGVILIRIVIKVLRKIFQKTKMPKVTYVFLLSVIRVALYMLLLIVICQVVGIPITGFIAVISAAGLALSLAMESSLSNLANGVVIISTRPFNEGDYIAIDSVEGTVVEIKMMHTIINTIDNKRISIPNSTVINSELINYSANPSRKVIFSFDIDYASDVEKAKQIVLDVIKNCNNVILEPEPFCALKTLNSSAITLTANCWCHNSDYWTVYYFVMENVFNEFKRNNINIPYNQMEVRLRTDEVIMPYKKEKLQQRDETIAAKPIEDNKQDAIDKVLNTLKPKRKKKSNK